MSFSPSVVKQNVLQQGGQVFPYVSRWNDVISLAAGVAQSYDLTAMRAAAGLVAGQSVFIIFAADAPFWANFSGNAAAIPSANVTDGTASEFCPNQRYIDTADTSISFISSTACNVSLQVTRP